MSQAQFDRREFMNVTAGAAAAWAAGLSGENAIPARAAEASRKTNGQPAVVAFTKSFQDRPIPEVCRIFKSLGLDGLDLTVRPRGHIEPADVQTELPKAVRAAKEHGVGIPMLTTAVTDDNADAERILATAAEQGIGRIKLGYYRYRSFGNLAEQMQDVRGRLAKVVRLGAKHGVLPCVHIHSGPYIPSHGTMLYDLIRDFSPQEIGAYVDMLHMTLEGGGDGWRQGLDLLAPWIALVAVKNFDWKKGGRGRNGQQTWHRRVVPVADGIAPVPEFVAILKKIGYSGVYSLHSEYKGRHSFEDLTTEGCIRQTAEDLKFFRPLLA